MFERAYLSKIQLADAERFAYLGDTTEGDHNVVRTRITTNKGTAIPVNYRVRMTEGGVWRVYDLDIDGVSLINNYRTQFNSIIERSSYPELVNRLKALREQRGGVRLPTPPSARSTDLDPSREASAASAYASRPEAPGSLEVGDFT